MLKYDRTEDGLYQPARRLPVESEYDVIVVGGGVAGVGAGIAAARGGWGCSSSRRKVSGG